MNELVTLGDYACAALPIGAQITREVGPFFGPAVHLGAVVASFGAKGLEKALCLKKCLNCDWQFLSPGEWKYEYIRGSFSLLKKELQKQLKDEIGGKALQVATAVYHIGELVLGAAELIQRYADKAECCKINPNFSKRFNTPVCEDVVEALRQVEASMEAERLESSYVRPVHGIEESNSEGHSLEFLLGEAEKRRLLKAKA